MRFLSNILLGQIPGGHRGWDRDFSPAGWLITVIHVNHMLTSQTFYKSQMSQAICEAVCNEACVTQKALFYYKDDSFKNKPSSC